MVDPEAGNAEDDRLVLLGDLAAIAERSDLAQAVPFAAALRKNAEMAKTLMRISPQRLVPIYQVRLEMAESINAEWKDSLADLSRL